MGVAKTTRNFIFSLIYISTQFSKIVVPIPPNEESIMGRRQSDEMSVFWHHPLVVISGIDNTILEGG